MCDETWQVGKSHGLRIVTHWVLIKDVSADVYERWSPDVIGDVANSLCVSVGVHNTGLHDDFEVVLYKERRAGRLSVIIWHADLRLDCHDVLSDEGEVEGLWNREVALVLIVSHEGREVSESHRLGVVADWVLVKDVEAARH